MEGGGGAGEEDANTCKKNRERGAALAGGREEQ